MTDKLFRRVRDKLQARLDSRQREYERWPAVQGLSNDAGNADVAGMTGWVYVRIGNNESVARAFNNKTSHRNGLTVWVGKLPEQPTLFQVLDERQPYFNESAGGQSTKPHGPQHVWPNEDPSYIRYRQLADCRVYAQDPADLTVGIADGYYFIEDEIYYYEGAAAVNLTSYVPTSGRVWVLLEMKPSGLNISSHTTSSFDLDTIPKATDQTYWRLAAVALRPAQTEITDYPGNQHIFDLRQSRVAGSEALYPLYVNGATKTVGSGKDFATIQAAIDWFADRKVVFGACVIDADADTYDEAVAFSDLALAAGATLTLRGDTRVLAGLSYVDGAAANQAGLSNGGDGTVTLSNAGTTILVTCATTNPDFDADGWGSGDKVLVYDNTGTVAEYTISATLDEGITLTTTAPNVGNDGTAICLLPNRRVERTSAGPCIEVDQVRGVALDGWYLETSTGDECYGVDIQNGAHVGLENVAIVAEDRGIILFDGSTIIADGGAVSIWGGQLGIYAFSSSIVEGQYAVAVAQTATGFVGGSFSVLNLANAIAVNCTTRGYSSQNFSFIGAVNATARQCGTGYYAINGAFLQATSTNANNNGNGTDYNPAPGAIPGYGNGNGNADIYAS